MKLSDDIKKWRAERPDEWTMDRFMEKAILLENSIARIYGYAINCEENVFIYNIIHEEFVKINGGSGVDR